jgi:hypothetical protein
MTGTITVEPAPPAAAEDAPPDEPVETPLNAGASMMLGLLLAFAALGKRQS